MTKFFQQLVRNPFTLICFILLITIILAGIFAPQIVPFDPTETAPKAKYLTWSAEHIFGTDQLGRDILSRLIFGVRSTVFYAMLAMVITLFIGLIIGLVAGLFGGKTDHFLMRACDLMLSFPAEVMILALVGMLGVGIGNILLAVALVKWAWYARMIRGVVQQFRHKEYVYFAQTIGTAPKIVITRHILPVAMTEIIVLASADIGSVILMISTLSFLGLGVQAPTPEWGVMLADAKNVMLLYPTQMLPAGLAIVLTVMAFNGFGDFLRDYFSLNSSKIKE